MPQKVYYYQISVFSSSDYDFSSEFFCHADFFIHRITRNLVGDFLGGDYSRIDAEATGSVDTDTPGIGICPTDFTDIHRFFSSGFFIGVFVTQISQMTQIFLFIGSHEI